MKKAIIPVVFVLSIFTFSCNKNNTENKINETIDNEASKYGIENDETEKLGTFSFDGKTFSANVNTQYFGDKINGNFSVLCQHNADEISDPNFELLQLVFVNENDVSSSPLKIYEGATLPVKDPQPGSVTVSLSGVGNGLGDKDYLGNSKSTGSITVKNKTVTLKDVVLFNSAGEKKTVNATLPF